MKTDAPFPERYSHRARARLLYGDDADRYARFYLESDPVADALAAWITKNGASARADFERALSNGIESGAAPELRRFFDRAQVVPDWVDFDEIRLGALAYQRFGVLGMIVLGAWSLVNGYHSSAAVKPLAFTGQLEHDTERRLAETARFVSEATQVDGLRSGRRGREIALRVSLIHAYVREACLRSEGWKTWVWGVPINQADMFGTLLEFSLLMIDGAMRLGFVITPEERKAILSMWRYCGHLSGVDPWLLSHLSSEADTRRIADLIQLIQPGPDEDSRVLTRRLLQGPDRDEHRSGPALLTRALVRFQSGLARALNGPEVADDLDIPDDVWKHSLHAVRAVVRPLEWLRRRIPGGTEMASRLGNLAVRSDLNRILQGSEPTFVG